MADFSYNIIFYFIFKFVIFGYLQLILDAHRFPSFAQLLFYQ